MLASTARFFGKVSPALDKSTNSIVFDRSKCGLCKSCVRACKVIAGQNVIGVVDGKISTASGKLLQDTNCIKCGQCTLACGPGALSEKNQIKEVEAAFKTHKVVCCQVAPSVRINLGEALGVPAGTVSTGRVVTALKKLGFQYVFDTNYGADMTIMEEATELVDRITKGTGKLPMFTSCCPAWINYVEQSAPELIPHISTCRSPMGMQSAIIKSEFAEMKKVKADDIFNVAIMPCIAKKDEAARPQLRTKDGVPETDVVLSCRELAKWIKQKKINFKALPETKFDEPYAESSGAGAIFGATGGVMEAAIRTAYHMITKRPFDNLKLTPIRGHKDGIKMTKLDIDGLEIQVAVCHGTANAMKLIKRIKSNDPELANLRFVEVMACPGGCVCGGGSARARTKKIMDKRIDGIYSIDETAAIRTSYQNKSLGDLYKRYLQGGPNSHRAHELLHTHFNDRKK